VLRFAQTSAVLHDALFQGSSLSHFQVAAASIPSSMSRGLHTVEGEYWLHGVCPVGSMKNYVVAWKNSSSKLATPTSVDFFHGVPLSFDDEADLEAHAIMWQELCELNDTSDTINRVIEFRWKEETMGKFFEVPGSATNSALVKILIEDQNGDSEYDDELKFRINLNPEASEDTPNMNLHRASIQLVGGKSSSHVYAIFFHTIDPTYQVHIPIADHRQPIFPTKEVFHQWHPLMAGLKRRPRLRFLIRLKPSESGPLDAMCGCCG